ncbi:universal stress protein [Kribbella sindirgiensis]|uniref:universal stress protein n=1 Tax=Kribbella sindirgiensis TaxID=1124744 RepID=UPI0013F48DD6|nr:universal stress protein [Kribbella sindirgiensis]
MTTWERSGPVVAEVDGTAESLRVVDYAYLEALRAHAELLLVAPYSPGASSAEARTESSADDRLRAAARHARQKYGDGLRIDTASREGSRRRALGEGAWHARMLVVGRKRVQGPRRLAVAEANLSLAGRVGCPLVVVPLSWRPGFTDRRVAVGIDGTALSNEAVEFALSTAASRDGDLIVVHAAPSRDVTRRAEEEHRWMTRADQLISEALAQWRSEFPAVRVTRFVSSRPVPEALVRESNEVGLVVVGAHLGAGPTSDPVVRASIAAMPCPVAIVPHHPREAVSGPVTCRASTRSVLTP